MVTWQALRAIVLMNIMGQHLVVLWWLIPMRQSAAIGPLLLERRLLMVWLGETSLHSIAMSLLEERLMGILSCMVAMSFCRAVPMFTEISISTGGTGYRAQAPRSMGRLLIVPNV